MMSKPMFYTGKKLSFLKDKVLFIMILFYIIFSNINTTLGI